MKAEITGYITALINVKELNVKRIKRSNPNIDIKAHQNSIEELSCLLDFVEDVPEEMDHITVVVKDEEADLLRKRIRELEDSCENMCEIEKILHKKIEDLNSENLVYQITCTGLNEKIEKLEAINEYKNIKNNS